MTKGEGESPAKKKCFVIMPLTVPDHLLERYGNNADHFNKTYEFFIEPAVDAAGFEVVPPSRDASENIHAGILRDLAESDLVLADLSGLNPNVFFELGIRTALDRPMSLTWDGLDALPFDTKLIHTHKYQAAPTYEINNEIEKLKAHIEATTTKSDGRNELWKYLGVGVTPGELDPEDASIHAKLDRLLATVDASLRSRPTGRVRRRSDFVVSVAPIEGADAVDFNAAAEAFHADARERMAGLVAVGRLSFSGAYGAQFTVDLYSSHPTSPADANLARHVTEELVELGASYQLEIGFAIESWTDVGS
jgi:hypothetical protein